MGRKVRELKQLARDFRAYGRLFSKQETFKDMQTATVCVGLAEFCENLALAVKHKRCA